MAIFKMKRTTDDCRSSPVILCWQGDTSPDYSYSNEIVGWGTSDPSLSLFPRENREFAVSVNWIEDLRNRISCAEEGKESFQPFDHDGICTIKSEHQECGPNSRLALGLVFRNNGWG